MFVAVLQDELKGACESTEAEAEKESELQSNRGPWRNISLHQGLIYAQVMDLTAVWGGRERQKEKKRLREITCPDPHVYL